MELTFGEKIRLLREEKELNQTQLCETVDITQRWISDMENDKYEPSMADIKAMCRYFNVSSDYLPGFPKNLPYPKRRK